MTNIIFYIIISIVVLFLIVLGYMYATGKTQSGMQSLKNFFLSPVTVILLFAIILFIYLLVSVSKAIKTTIKEKPWPTYINECPDYWIKSKRKDANGNIIVNPSTNEPIDFCVNVKQIGSCKEGEGSNRFDYFPVTDFGNNDDTEKLKCTWTKKCDLTWDGITNKSGLC